MAEDWTRAEVEVIVAEYFAMLTKEQAGIPFTKSEVRKRILPLLNNRSEAAVEFKNRNISAALARNGNPYIRGYLPAYNYQRALLDEIVSSYVRDKPEVEDTFKLFAETIPKPGPFQFEGMEVEVPKRETVAHEPELTFSSPVKVNYIESEQRNRLIGKAGESIALEFEKWRLVRAGKSNLVDKIEWVSETQGDGLGYDILSRNDNGTDRYIEVKSTKLTKEAPFFFSERELSFSKKYRSSFYMYRLFDLKTSPKALYC